MVEKIKTDADRKIKKSSIVAKYIGTFFFLIKTKSSLSMYILIFSTISQILKTKFDVFRHKHAKTGPNCSHKLVTFLK